MAALTYDDIISWMTELARPVAHVYSECCTASSSDESRHSLQCDSLTATIATMMGRAWMLGHEYGENSRK